MDITPKFPVDDNGDILRRMNEGGDDLIQSRMIDFCFVFSDRKQALAFARDTDDQDLIVCISYYTAKGKWQVIVKHNMIPEHKNISTMEAALTTKAQAVGGKADGWGCMQIKRK